LAALLSAKAISNRMPRPPRNTQGLLAAPTRSQGIVCNKAFRATLRGDQSLTSKSGFRNAIR
jgi:hypothetical protein